MSTSVKDPGGVDGNPGGNDDKTKDVSNDSDKDTSPKPQSVAYESYQKALDEAKAAKKKVAEFERAKREADESKLKQDGEWKKLLEQREIELKETREKLSAKDKMIEDNRKMAAFLDSVTGEVPKQYWSLIDLDQIAVDPETGRPDEASVKKVASVFEKQFAEVIKKPSTSKLPNDAPQGGGGKLTYKQWLELPLKEKLARQKDVDRSTI
jgi:hypothetical protein